MILITFSMSWFRFKKKDLPASLDCIYLGSDIKNNATGVGNPTKAYFFVPLRSLKWVYKIEMYLQNF